MKVKNITVTDTSLKEKLFPLLLNNVFHVTSEESFKQIQESGLINSNISNTYPHTFPQSSKSFGTLNGMVNLIDLREKTSFKAEECFDYYYFLRPSRDWKVVIFLFLNETFYKDLKLQARSNPPLVGENYIPMEEIRKGMYIPEFECWYPEKITVDNISDALIVSISHG